MKPGDSREGVAWKIIYGGPDRNPVSKCTGISPRLLPLAKGDGGDDIRDLPIMKRAGIPVVVQDPVQALNECSVYVTRAYGTHGAVREAVDGSSNSAVGGNI